MFSLFAYCLHGEMYACEICLLFHSNGFGKIIWVVSFKKGLLVGSLYLSLIKECRCVYAYLSLKTVEKSVVTSASC